MAKKFPVWDNPGTRAAQFLMDPEGGNDGDDLAAAIRNSEELINPTKNVSKVTQQVRSLIKDSASQLEELKGTLKSFIEEHTQQFVGNIAQELVGIGFVNDENLCTKLQQQESANIIIEKMDMIIQRLDNIQARRDSSVASVVVGEISKNIKKIDDKLNELAEKVLPLLQKQERDKEDLEEAMEISKEGTDYAQYVSAVKIDENTVQIRERLDDLSVAVREGFRLLREGEERNPRIDAIWANINHSLSQLHEVTMVCPNPNDEFDEKMAAEFGSCREQSTYEHYENEEGKLAMSLQLLEGKPLRKSKTKLSQLPQSKRKVGFVNNLTNTEVRRAPPEIKKPIHGCMPKILPKALSAAIKREPDSPPLRLPLHLPPPAPHRSAQRSAAPAAASAATAATTTTTASAPTPATSVQSSPLVTPPPVLLYSTAPQPRSTSPPSYHQIYAEPPPGFQANVRKNDKKGQAQVKQADASPPEEGAAAKIKIIRKRNDEKE